ncbi:MAG: methyltransferase [Sphingopyxis sp.]|nr:MAG: methyltransferase [Sphingopyxis sp.]
MMRASILLALATCAMVAAPVYAGATPAAPAGDSAETGPDFEAAVSDPGRDQADIKLDDSRKPAEVLEFMGLESGDTVVDLFAGGGYYSEIMGRVVGPEGSVTAVNPPQFTTSEQSKAKWAGVAERQPNVKMVPSQLPDYKPAPDSIDFAMLHLIYHDFYWESEEYKFEKMNPVAVLSNLFVGMKPGGIVAVIDHVGSPGDTRAVVEKTHRIDPTTVRSDFLKAGFVLDGESDMFANPDDDLELNVFDPAVRGQTDRIVMRFRKPG